MGKKTQPATPPTDALAEEIKELSASSTNELQAAVSRLDKLLGDAHWLSVGTYKEQLLISHLARMS